MSETSVITTTESDKPKNNVEKRCESVAASIDSSKGALNELVYLKENILNKSLPNETVVQIDIITSRLFQSLSDLEDPLKDLMNYARLSTSKEDKTMALHKLQASYEKKCQQLDIALRQLARCHTQTEKLSKERRIQKWEKLFLTALGNKTPVRQWRFLVPQIMENAGKGSVHFSAYLDSLLEEKQIPT